MGHNLVAYAAFISLVLNETPKKLDISLCPLAAKALNKIGINQNSMETKKFVAKNLGTMQTYLLRQKQLNTQLYQKLDYQAPIEPRKKYKPEKSYVKTDDFLSSYPWRKIRLQALLLHGRKCLCCGATPTTGAVLNVDHIKPRKTHPELALDINNLQVLCHECNHGKGNWNTTDFRLNTTLG